MRLVTGNGNAATSQAPDDTMVRLLQKARLWWKRICEEGLNTVELARLEGTSKTYVRSVTRLAMLSPTIVEQILGGSHGAMLTATRLVQIKDLPVSWDEQERLIRSLG
jgi:site-specific DNA recombinase